MSIDREIRRKLELGRLIRQVDDAIERIRNMSDEEFREEMKKYGIEPDQDDKYPHQEKDS